MAGGLQPGRARPLASQWLADPSGAGGGCVGHACPGDPRCACVLRTMPVDPAARAPAGTAWLRRLRHKVPAQLDHQSGGGASMPSEPISRCIPLSFACKPSTCEPQQEPIEHSAWELTISRRRIDLASTRRTSGLGLHGGRFAALLHGTIGSTEHGRVPGAARDPAGRQRHRPRHQRRLTERRPALIK